MTLGQQTDSSAEDRSLREDVKQAVAAIDAVTEPPSRIPVTTTLPRTPPKGKAVAWLVPGLGMATKLTSSAEAAAKALGWRLVPIGFDATNLETVNSAVEDAVKQGVDYIVRAGRAVFSLYFWLGTGQSRRHSRCALRCRDRGRCVRAWSYRLLLLFLFVPASGNDLCELRDLGFPGSWPWGIH